MHQFFTQNSKIKASPLFPICAILSLRNFFFFCLSCLFFNCTSEPFLYDKTGFEKGDRPNISDPEAPVKIAPDYYYRQPNYAQQGAPNPYSQQFQAMPYQQPYYNPQPPQAYYYPPMPAYNPYGNYGGSRFYSNPYAIIPPNQYPNYDADQYYVPPASHNNIEPQQRNLAKPNPANY